MTQSTDNATAGRKVLGSPLRYYFLLVDHILGTFASCERIGNESAEASDIAHACASVNARSIFGLNMRTLNPLKT